MKSILFLRAQFRSAACRWPRTGDRVHNPLRPARTVQALVHDGDRKRAWLYAALTANSWLRPGDTAHETLLGQLITSASLNSELILPYDAGDGEEPAVGMVWPFKIADARAKVFVDGYVEVSARPWADEDKFAPILDPRARGSWTGITEMVMRHFRRLNKP